VESWHLHESWRRNEEVVEEILVRKRQRQLSAHSQQRKQNELVAARKPLLAHARHQDDHTQYKTLFEREVAAAIDHGVPER
jgi:hypothetical protein